MRRHSATLRSKMIIDSNLDIDDIFFITDIIGISAFTLSGFLIAVRNNLDLLGVFVSAVLTALGGGIMRDIMLDHAPLAFMHFYLIVTVLLVIFSAFLFRIHHIKEIETNEIFIASDTVGLVSFSIAGSVAALETQYNFFGVITAALLTAVGGGSLRDILINKIPEMLTKGFYATVTVILALLVKGIYELGYLNLYTIAAVFATGLLLRYLAIHYRWQLPKL